jgi:hypothetical protein
VKLEAGKDIYPIVDFGELIDVAIDTGVRTMTGHYYPLKLISPANWERLRGPLDNEPKVRGIPQFITVAGSHPSLCLYPAPDKDYELSGRYYPAARSL